MTEMDKSKKMPDRIEVPTEYCWNLSSLFNDAHAWEDAFKKLEGMMTKIRNFKGTLGSSPERLKECLDFNNELGILEERLGSYAQLRVSEDGADSDSQGRFSRFMNLATKCGALSSYQTPEILAIPDNEMARFLNSDILSGFNIFLIKMLRWKLHVLSENEERLLAMQTEFALTAQKTFSSLVDVDMNFGEVDTDKGKTPLTQSTYSLFMINKDRDVRQKAYLQFLDSFEKHKNTIANLYSGSVQLDVYRGRVRKFNSSIEASLFNDNVSVTVYDNLILSIHENIPILHKYYNLRARYTGLKSLHLYDLRVPLVADIKMQHTYEEAVELVVKSLKPMGSEYTSTLEKGLLGGWTDRYENKGKRSGAFSAGSFTGDPFILLNYQDNVLNDVFTLAHEAGHSMHSWYSTKNNPFQHYNYTIFVAEVASTFNEQLLFKYMMEQTDDIKLKTYLVNKQIDDIIGTIYRQTMFAEYEKITHEMTEANQPLTVASLRAEYRKLLKKYFGPDIVLDDTSDLEGLRIPHFYSAFYVYKYATGLSAAIALSLRVLNGGETELNQYRNFLRSGGSKYPLEQLKDAGIDMTTPEPVNAALKLFADLVDQLDELLE